MKTCQKCGAKAENDDVYCPDCGIKLKDVGRTRKITVWTILKVIGLIIFFIIFINIFKNQPLVALVFLGLFLLWTDLLNGILKKLFNSELSTGVKIVITAVLVSLFFFSTSQVTTVKQPQIMYEPVHESVQITDEQIYNFIDRMNKVLESRADWELKEMLEKGTISHEVFKDLQNIINSKDQRGIILELADKRFYGDNAELVIRVITKTGYEQMVGKTGWIFQKEVNFENTGDVRWKLVKIEPRLSDIVYSRSFEEEMRYKLEDMNRPAIAIREQAISTGYLIKSLK